MLVVMESPPWGKSNEWGLSARGFRAVRPWMRYVTDHVSRLLRAGTKNPCTAACSAAIIQAMDDEIHGERLAAQAALYDAAFDTEMTDHALDFMARSQLLLRITSDNEDAAGQFIHTDAGRVAARREYDQLSDDDREELKRVIAHHWSLNLNLAVRRMWHAANVLGFKGDTLDPKYVAMLAAIYISRSPDDVYAELEQLAS